MRVKTGVVRRANHKKVLKQAKGYLGRRRSVYKLAKQGVIKAGVFSYRDRKVNKRVRRAIWIVRLNSALQKYEMKYSEFIHKLALGKVEVNRKILANMALKNPAAFEAVVNKIK